MIAPLLQIMETKKKCQAGLDYCFQKLQLCDMKILDARRYKLQAEMFKALAHPMRIAILEKLKDRPWCVCELAAELGIEKSVASKHLAQLRDAGIIDDERHGTLVEYRLIAPCVLSLAACAEQVVVENRRGRLDAASAEGERADRSTGLKRDDSPPSLRIRRRAR
jgi:ArsR family transcriptional regulator